jgi:translation initiation factor eIF-2B subunit delta
MGVVWSLVKSIFGASQPAEYPPPASQTDSEPEDVPDIQPNAPTTTDNDTERPLATMAPSKDPEVSNFADRPPATLETPSANGQPTKHKKMDQTGQKDATAGAGEEKISGAELKKRKQAEKAARRAKEKQGAEQAATTSSTSQGQTQATGHSKKGSSAGKDVPQSSQSKADSVSTATPSHALSTTKPSKAHHKRTPSSTNLQKQRTRDRDKEDEAQVGRSLDDLKPEEKRVPLFGHLYGAPRREHYRGAEKDVHPSVLALGMQMVDWVIVGANARTVAMLMAFKQVRYVLPAL